MSDAKTNNNHFKNRSYCPMNTIKQKYTEPLTLVSEVEMEGFICESVKCTFVRPEVDEYVNKGTIELNLDEIQSATLISDK